MLIRCQGTDIQFFTSWGILNTFWYQGVYKCLSLSLNFIQNSKVVFRQTKELASQKNSRVFSWCGRAESIWYEDEIWSRVRLRSSSNFTKSYQSTCDEAFLRGRVLAAPISFASEVMCCQPKHVPNKSDIIISLNPDWAAKSFSLHFNSSIPVCVHKFCQQN